MNRDIIETLARAILKVGAGYLVAKGFATDSSATELVGALTGVIGIAWGIYSAKQGATAQTVTINKTETKQ